MEVEIVAGDGCGEIWEGCLFGTDVMRTDFLADVATKNPVADFGAEVFWNDTFVFDCEVGNAFGCVHFVVGIEGTGGAGDLAFVATAALHGFSVERFVGWDI